MPFASSHGVDIAYQVDGRPEDPPVILIHGLGRQLIEWDAAFVHRIVAAGYRAIVMDNRDVGLSTHLDEKVALGEVRRSLERNEPVAVPYHLNDMAADAVSVLDQLGIGAAHVVGASMGGYIGQCVAIDWPERVLSLTSVMSSTGRWDVGGPTREGERALFHAPPPDRVGAIETTIETRRMLATKDAFDEKTERVRAATAFDRSFDPAGVGRQLAAIWASGDRTDRLREIDTPTLVIHGTADRLVDISGGRATAAAVPNSELVEIEGMGHDLPPIHWGRILDPLIRHLDTVTPHRSGRRIVPCGPDKAETMAELCRRAFAEDVERYGAGPPDMDKADTHRYLSSVAHTHALELDGETVGGVYLFNTSPGEWYLGTVFVDPAYWGSGFGSELMRFAEHAHPRLEHITLDTPYGNEHLHRFYEALGYSRTGGTKPGDHQHVPDRQFHLYRYEKTFD